MRRRAGVDALTHERCCPLMRVGRVLLKRCDARLALSLRRCKGRRRMTCCGPRCAPRGRECCTLEPWPASRRRGSATTRGTPSTTPCRSGARARAVPRSPALSCANPRACVRRVLPCSGLSLRNQEWCVCAGEHSRADGDEQSAPQRLHWVLCVCSLGHRECCHATSAIRDLARTTNCPFRASRKAFS